jgi:predicted permease
MRFGERLERVRHDVRFALRQLARAPGFTLVAVLTLALGIGANSAIFSVVHAVLLAPLPYPDAERVLRLRQRAGPRDTQGRVVTFGDFGAWEQRARSFEALGAYTFGGVTLTGGCATATGACEPQPLRVRYATAGYWRVLSAPPAVGRYYRADEDRPGAPDVVVLSHALWTSTFGADPRVVGRSVTLSGKPYTVVGVAPPAFQVAAAGTDAWVPLAITSEQLADHRDHELAVLGRVRAGVTEERALAELTEIETALVKEFGKSDVDGGVVAQSLRDALVGSARELLLILLGAVGLVLLIACGNVASLLLARGGVREKEIAVRAAIGAARGRLVSQLLAESLVLAALGAVAGVGVAAAGVRFLKTTMPPDFVPRLSEASLDAPVLLFTLAVAVGCGVLFGLYPALRGARVDLQHALRQGGRDGGAVRYRLRAALVVGEVSVALVLLVGAGLLVRSAVLMRRVPLGFDPSNVLVAGVGLPEARYPTDEATQAAFARLESAVAAVPGVRAVGMVNRIPVGAGGWDCGVRAEGSAESSFGANVRVATPGFAAAFRIPMVRGRFFTASDASTAPPVAVINQGLARRLFGTADPIGRRVANCIGGSGDAPEWRTVVGVMNDMHVNGLDQEAADEVYLPSAQVMLERGRTFVVRGAVPAASLAPAIKRAVAVFDAQLPLSGVRTMDEVVARSLAVSRFTTFLLLLLGGTGLALAVVGIYGVIAYFVVQRTREIGVRLALGASPAGVVRLVVRQGLALALGGVALGLVAAWGLARVIQSRLFAVSAHDPLTFVGVAVLLTAVALVASAVPAWRASRIDRLVALRGP